MNDRGPEVSQHHDTDLNAARAGVVAIVVAYESEVDELLKNLEECCRAVRVLICDNSRSKERRRSLSAFAETQGLVYLPMDGNCGIGAAQNQGIEFARQCGAKFVLLLDDDSRLPLTSLDRLLSVYHVLQASGHNVGAICARAIDRHEEKTASVDAASGAITVCRELMSSGSLIPLSVLQVVGGMDEELFIDYVDFDWGWRAIACGYRLYRVEGAIFSHALGEGRRQVLGIGLRLKSPIRHYYQTRNVLRMLGRPYAPLGWKVTQLATALARGIAFSVLVAPRRARLSYWFRGLIDGLADCGRRRVTRSR